MMYLHEGLQPAAAGLLLYVVAWVLWRCFLSSARPYELDAEERARALLAEVLSDKECQQLALSGYLLLRSPSVPGRMYRIPERSGWVDIYESGKLAVRVCVQPNEALPASDVVLMHKLMIEGNEQDYLSRANVRWMRQGRRP